MNHTYTIRVTGTFPGQNKNEIVTHLMAAFREFVKGTFEVSFEPAPSASEDFHIVFFREWDVDAAYLHGMGLDKNPDMIASRAVALLRGEILTAYDFHGMPEPIRMTLSRVSTALQRYPAVVLPQHIERKPYLNQESK